MDAEYDLFHAAGFQLLPNGINGDPCSLILREASAAGGDAAEGYAFEVLFLCQFQAGAVAGGKKRPVIIGKWAGDDGADRVQDVFRRKVVAPGELRLSGGFLVPLSRHDLCTFFTKLQACRGVDNIVDAIMPRAKTAKKLRIGRVYNGVRVQPGDISLPEDDAFVRRDSRKFRDMHDALGLPLCAEKRVLCLQKTWRQRPGLPDVHQAAEEITLTFRIG